MKDLKTLLFEARERKWMEAQTLSKRLKTGEAVTQARIEVARLYAALDELDNLLIRAGLIAEQIEWQQSQKQKESQNIQESRFKFKKEDLAHVANNLNRPCGDISSHNIMRHSCVSDGGTI